MIMHPCVHLSSGQVKSKLFFFLQDLARVSIMADVKQVKDAIMQEELPSQQVSNNERGKICSFLV